MKKLSLLPIALFVMLIAAMVNPFGCREKKENTKRYFYIGYNIDNGERRNNGNFTAWYDTFPSKEQFREILFQHFKCDGFSMNQVIITGFYEFKDSLEYYKWKNPIGGSFDTCINITKSILDYKWEMISGPKAGVVTEKTTTLSPAIKIFPNKIQ